MSNIDRYPGTYNGLRRLVRRLRSEEGCPWDREQTHDSMKSLFLQECYELIEAIEQDDFQGFQEELGDVLFHLVFQIQIGEEQSTLTQKQMFKSLIEKLIRRHPHVFGEAHVEDVQELYANWDAIKREEKQGTGASILDGVPKPMPALSYAQETQTRAARTGFDWDDYSGVLEKVVEELKELEAAPSEAEREAELGDLLFSMVNAARWLGVDAEGALRQANSRFYRRYSTMETLSRERGLSFSDLPLDEKEALWQEAKQQER